MFTPLWNLLDMHRYILNVLTELGGWFVLREEEGGWGGGRDVCTHWLMHVHWFDLCSFQVWLCTPICCDWWDVQL